LLGHGEPRRRREDDGEVGWGETRGGEGEESYQRINKENRRRRSLMEERGSVEWEGQNVNFTCSLFSTSWSEDFIFDTEPVYTKVVAVASGLIG
jgi:hypothetical protein